jgi:hypothetical protein
VAGGEVVLEEVRLADQQLLVDVPTLLLGPDDDGDEALSKPPRVETDGLAPGRSGLLVAEMLAGSRPIMNESRASVVDPTA